MSDDAALRRDRSLLKHTFQAAMKAHAEVVSAHQNLGQGLEVVKDPTLHLLFSEAAAAELQAMEKILELGQALKEKGWEVECPTTH